jgi:hypothetical protein
MLTVVRQLGTAHADQELFKERRFAAVIEGHAPTCPQDDSGYVWLEPSQLRALSDEFNLEHSAFGTERRKASDHERIYLELPIVIPVALVLNYHDQKVYYASHDHVFAKMIPRILSKLGSDKWAVVIGDDVELHFRMDRLEDVLHNRPRREVARPMLGTAVAGSAQADGAFTTIVGFGIGQFVNFGSLAIDNHTYIFNTSKMETGMGLG